MHIIYIINDVFTTHRFWLNTFVTLGVCDRGTKECKTHITQSIFIYLGFYVAFNTVQVISRRVVGRAEETSIYSSLGFGTVNCRPTASNYQLSHLRPCRESNPSLRSGRQECYHSATVAPHPVYISTILGNVLCGGK